MKKYILIGNPNTGKTTLLNTITNSNEHVGNWHGVTVGVIEKKVKIDGEECIIVDLPGLYSLDAYSMEEKISVDYLKENKDATVINLCDANNIERNLLLTLQLLSNGYKAVVAMNMAKENKNVNYKKLEEEINVPVVEIDARNKSSVKELLSVADSFIGTGNKLQMLGNSAEIIFRRIKQIMKKVYKFEPEIVKTLTFMDRFVLNKFLFLPIFIGVIGLVFYITFGSVGSYLSSVLSDLLDLLSNKVLGAVSAMWGENWFYNFLAGAIFGGISSVVAFLPQVALLFFSLGILEDIGYLPRVAYMLDGMLKKVGMTGRSLFSLLMGFGCTASALITTRNMDNEKLKKRTAFVLPFMSCSAKLPIFIVFASAFFQKSKVLVLVGLYFFSILIGVFVSWLLCKLSKVKTQDVFILEIPKYRLPRLKSVISNVLQNVKSFIWKVGTVILISSSVIWILTNFTISFEYIGASADTNNMLISISNVIYPIFKPLGFSSSLVVVVLLSGLIGKEMVVSTIGILNSVSITGLTIAESILLSSSPVSFSIHSAISFLVFTLLYSPCISAFEVASKEIGYKFAITSFIFQFMIAYLVSFLAYAMLEYKLARILLFVVIVLAFVVGFVVKSKKQTKTTCGYGGCYGCNQICGGTRKTI